ncbi:cell envelope integrity protein CreD [Vogesella amnigena]|uniref:Cell envelope integrity protein CreD n=1 Tax=Vogesella amnigena TaxID=1507449 RepID=A0ABV7TV82_9NEIS
MKMAWKVAALGGMVLLMLLVLALVRGLLDERQNRAEEVRREIAQFSAGEQDIAGPYLVLPFTRTTRTRQPSEQGKVTGWEEQSENGQLLLTPAQLDGKGKLAVEMLRRGLFEAPIYRSQLQFAGHFVLPPLKQYEQQSETVDKQIRTNWGQPYLAMGLSDVRGIQQLGGQLGGQALVFAPGSQLKEAAHGVHAPAPLPATARDTAQQLPFLLNLQLSGSSSLLLEPSGDSSSITLSGNWPHPSFAGQFAPLSRTVGDQGFSARWQTTELATGGTCHEKEGCQSVRVGLRLLDPVDRYVLNERTMKYAELFVLLMMGAVFLLEVVNRLSVHPVQYTLVMLGLAMFFLLTLSLSEHLGFSRAYWLAALASAALQGWYCRYILASWRRGVGFAAMLLALFGLLFMILRSEDMALLLGSLVLFALLALTMFFTRNVDWGALGKRSDAA